MKTILYFQYPWAKWQERLGGVYRYAIGRKWQIVLVEYGQNFSTVKDSLRFWNPDGCLVENDFTLLPTFHHSDFGKTPVVYFDAFRSRVTGDHYGVVHDSVQTAMLGVEELMSLGLSEYAFVNYFEPREWADRRCKVMETLVKSSGNRFYSFDGGAENIAEYLKTLKPFLKALPKPCGVFAANDAVASYVLGVCSELRIRVPEDLSVVGVDDDDLVCENTQPKLTSVKPDFELSGYLAAKLLDGCFVHSSKRGKVVRFGPKLVVRRGSTSRFRRRDDDAKRGLEFIRENLTKGISAIDVIRIIGGSRRSAEKRFFKLTGRSIGAEIARQRLIRAKQLLMKRSVPINSIYFQCGYANPETLRRAFKLETGSSLSEWRNLER